MLDEEIGYLVSSVPLLILNNTTHHFFPMPSFSDFDQSMMQRAIQLAEKGRFSTRPNPMVGCVIAKDQEIIGEGYHARCGQAHAEVNAIQHALSKGISAHHATAYVTLEPCSHYGRTPPCAELLIKHQIKRVVIGILDQDKRVSGRGVELLKQAGIIVEVGCLERQCHELNAGFLRRISGGLPYVRVKSAMSVDGRTAMASGESKWITGDVARMDVQHLRARSGAIITGINTVLADNPALTVRPQTWKNKAHHDIPQPLRVVLDTKGQSHEKLNIIQEPYPVLIMTSDEGFLKLSERSFPPHVSIVKTTVDHSGRLVLADVLRYVGDLEINDVMVEAGSILSGQFIESGVVDELWLYVAPVIMGSSGKPLFSIPIERMADKYCFEWGEATQLGPDLRLIGRNLHEKVGEEQ